MDWSRTLSWACHCAGFGVETIRSYFGVWKEKYGSTADLDDRDIVLLVRRLDNVKRSGWEKRGVSVCVGDLVRLNSVDACLGRSLGLVIWIRGGCVKTCLKVCGERVVLRGETL